MSFFIHYKSKTKQSKPIFKTFFRLTTTTTTRPTIPTTTTTTPTPEVSSEKLPQEQTTTPETVTSQGTEEPLTTTTTSTTTTAQSIPPLETLYSAPEPPKASTKTETYEGEVPAEFEIGLRKQE